MIPHGNIPHDIGLQADMWLFRVDTNGNMVWEDKIGYSNLPENAYTLGPTLDGEFALAGEVVNSENHMNVGIAKEDFNGNGWGFQYGARMEDTYAYDAVATTHYGVVAAGYQTLNNAGADV